MPDREHVDDAPFLMHPIDQASGWHGIVANVIPIQRVKPPADKRMLSNQFDPIENPFAKPAGSIRVALRDVFHQFL